MVSDAGISRRYYAPVESWVDWPKRLRAHVKDKRLRWGKVADQLGITEGALRHWLNGRNQVNLIDFFTLCGIVGADPRAILFGEPSPSVSHPKTQAVRAR